MPPQLTLAEASVKVKADTAKAVADIDKVHNALKKVPKNVHDAEHALDILGGKMGVTFANLEHAVIHGFSHIGRAFAAGGIIGVAAMEGVHLLVEGIEGIAEKSREATKAAEEFRTTINKLALDSFEAGVKFDAAMAKMDRLLHHDRSQETSVEKLERLNPSAGKYLGEQVANLKKQEEEARERKKKALDTTAGMTEQGWYDKASSISSNDPEMKAFTDEAYQDVIQRHTKYGTSGYVSNADELQKGEQSGDFFLEARIAARERMARKLKDTAYGEVNEADNQIRSIGNRRANIEETAKEYEAQHPGDRTSGAKLSSFEEFADKLIMAGSEKDHGGASENTQEEIARILGRIEQHMERAANKPASRNGLFIPSGPRMRRAG